MCSPVGCMVEILVSTLQSHRVGCDALGEWPGHCGGSPRPGVRGLWCVPLPTPSARSFGLPGDTGLSLWLGNVTRCPLGTQLQLLRRCVQHGQGVEVALQGEGEALACGPWARSSPPARRVPRLGRWGRAGGCPALGGGCGESGTSHRLPWEVQEAGIQPGELFFPGKGYSLSLGAVVIAGGGSGLNFHADALRSRRLEHVRAVPLPTEDQRQVLLCSLFALSRQEGPWCSSQRSCATRVGLVWQPNCSARQGRCCGRYLPSLLLCWAPAERPRPCLAFPDTISTPLRPVPEGHSVRESGL